MSIYGVFSGLNAGKYGPEKTPYLDTFHAVIHYMSRIKKCFKDFEQHLQTLYSQATEANLEPSQIFKMEPFAKIINAFQPITIFAKSSILDVSLGS